MVFSTFINYYFTRKQYECKNAEGISSQKIDNGWKKCGITDVPLNGVPSDDPFAPS